MICIVIKGPSFSKAKEQILEASLEADLLELRLDYLSFIEPSAIQELLSFSHLPFIFTLRPTLEGGLYEGTEETRLNTIFSLANLKPAYLDLEHTTPFTFIQKINFAYPKIKIILSYHKFQNTPKDLEGLYQNLQKKPAFLYKIALWANSSIDTLQLISWAQKKENKVIAISMGPYGELSRILAKPITYASLKNEEEFGQIDVKTLKQQYNYKNLNAETDFYGLIGDPISQSISEKTHNTFIRSRHLNAVYVKIKISKEELPFFLELCKNLPFKGFSVTMPLKETIIPYLDELSSAAAEIGAVNTIVFKEGKKIGYNTDAPGAMNALKAILPLEKKHVILLGSGGAAKAIAYEAKKENCLVTLLQRADLPKIANYAKIGYDILINCTPSSLPIDPACILTKALVMDITTKPKDTLFLTQAKEKGCAVLYGYKMFLEQAKLQFSLWFEKKAISLEEDLLLEKAALDSLVEENTKS